MFHVGSTVGVVYVLVSPLLDKGQKMREDACLVGEPSCTCTTVNSRFEERVAEERRLA